MEANSIINGYLRSYINKGIPLLIGISAPIALNLVPIYTPVDLGMVESAVLEWGLNSSNLFSHAITEGYTLPNQFDTYVSFNYGELLTSPNYVGVPVTKYSFVDTRITSLAIEKNTIDLFGAPYGARCGYIGWLYQTSTIALSNKSKYILNRFIKWCVS